MWGKIGEKLADWAITTISALPPSQNLVAFFIVLALAFPMLSAGIKAFRSPAPPPAPPPPQPELVQQTPWFIATINTISVQVQDIQRDVDSIEQALGHISREVSDTKGVMLAVERLLRVRVSAKRRRAQNQD